MATAAGCPDDEDDDDRPPTLWDEDEPSRPDEDPNTPVTRETSLEKIATFSWKEWKRTGIRGKFDDIHSTTWKIVFTQLTNYTENFIKGFQKANKLNESFTCTIWYMGM